MKSMTTALRRSPRFGAACALVLLGAAAHAARVHVDAAATPPGDGETWATAYASLRGAVDASAPGDEIWIAGGTYRADDAGDRNGALVLKQDMKLYGGFTAGQDASEARDPLAPATILCGELQGDADPANNTESGVRFAASGSLLDGLVFQNMTSLDATNGVLGFKASGVSYGTTRIVNCVFSNNVGRVALVQGSPVFSNCVFRANSGGNGAVVRINASGVSPTFLDCVFDGNAAASGGAVYFDTATYLSYPVFRRCVFSGNTASANGGAIYYQISYPVLESCLFTNNVAQSGGALYCPNTFWQSRTMPASNCVFVANQALTGNGGALVNSKGGLAFADCVFSRNVARSNGGVLYGSSGEEAAPMSFVRCRFVSNQAANGGVGYYTEGYSATFLFRECDVIANVATNSTGGMLTANWVKSIDLEGCRFVGNASKGSGGVFYVNSSQWRDTDVRATNCVFSGNVSQYNGGAFYGTASLTKWVRAQFTHCRFIGNRAPNQSGGAFYCSQGTNRFSSCTFAWNQAANGGLGATVGGPTFLANAIAWGNSATTKGSLFHFKGTTAASFPHLSLDHCATDQACDVISTASGSYVSAADSATAAAYVFDDRGGNLAGDPRFAPTVSGTVAAGGVFDAATGLTALSVAGGPFAVNALADTTLFVLGVNAYQVVSNSADALVVLGDASAEAVDSAWVVLSPRLSSRTGRWTGAGWIADVAQSRCIDAGPQAWPVGGEPVPNGGRVNMGFDAGTAYASLSPHPSTVVIVR